MSSMQYKQTASRLESTFKRTLICQNINRKNLLKGNTEKISLEKYDWNFDSCPRDEINDCYVYEYSRESDYLIKGVRNLRKNIDYSSFDDLYKAYYNKAFYFVGSRSRNSLYFFPEFPKKPYLSVTKSERKRRITCLFGDEHEATAKSLFAEYMSLPWDFPERLKISYEGKKRLSLRTGHQEIVVLKIDWTYPDYELIRKVSQFKSVDITAATKFYYELHPDYPTPTLLAIILE